MISKVQGAQRALNLMNDVANGLEKLADDDPVRAVVTTDSFETLLSALAGDFELIPLGSVVVAATMYSLQKRKGG